MLLVQPLNEKSVTERVAVPGAGGLVTTVAAICPAEQIPAPPPAMLDARVTLPVSCVPTWTPGFTLDPSAPGAPAVRPALDANAATGSMASTAAMAAGTPSRRCLCTRSSDHGGPLHRHAQWSYRARTMRSSRR